MGDVIMMYYDANYAECDKECASVRGSTRQLDVIQDEYDYIVPEEDM